MRQEDLELLRGAKATLERASFLVRLTSAIGTPIEKGLDALPDQVSRAVSRASEMALSRALAVAVSTLSGTGTGRSTDRAHRVAVAASGAAGGAFGVAALALELPLSTTIILRSIADIARSEGEALTDPETQMACLEVFALGGSSSSDDAAETGYWTVRLALANATGRAAAFVASHGLADRSAPPMVRLITAIAARFNVVVGQKVAAQAIPLVGAAGGALVNTIFIGHFQDMARAHFTVRRLERAYGEDEVRRCYETL